MDHTLHPPRPLDGSGYYEHYGAILVTVLGPILAGNVNGVYHVCGRVVLNGWHLDNYVGTAQQRGQHPLLVA